eukprot:TRINITY_DN17516_c0_g2_i1.p1 TRINITY_DN17516_c0_g2~~TRINITY_DN17516_c0_g2_i1.p1  ORF type:complete len:105 (+),score=16.00 TRINITY_DN17516_c0_g2_i1:75-389(+)
MSSCVLHHQAVHYVQQPVVVGQVRPVYTQPAVLVAQPSVVYQPSQVWAPETPEQQLKNRVRRSKNVALSFLISFAALSAAFLVCWILHVIRALQSSCALPSPHA